MTCGFCLERFPLPLGAWDGLRYFIVALPEPSINYFSCFFAQNLDCWYMLEAVLTSTHNLCLRANIRKNEHPCEHQFYYIKVGCKRVLITRICYPDGARAKENH